MGKHLSGYDIHQEIKAMGHKEIPSGSHWQYLDPEMNKVVIIAPDSPMPRIFYVEQRDGEMVAFKAM